MKTVTVQLSVKDRLVLLGTLPGEGTFLEIKLIQSLKEDLALSIKEHEELKVIQQPNGAIFWDIEAAKKTGPKSIEVPEVTASLIVKTLNGLDKASKLTIDHIPLYEMFVVKQA